jgi:hypothetical protein
MINTFTNRFNDFESVHYLGYYFKYRDPRFDEVSKELLNFKHNYTTSVNKWTRVASVALKPLLLEWNKSTSKKITVLRALGHDETEVDPSKPMDMLGRKLEMENPDILAYLPSWLSKSHPNPALHTLNAAQRIEALESVYQMIGLDTENSKKRVHYLILDDVITTGSTLNAIKAIILKQRPNAKIHAFGLCKTFDDVVDPDEPNQQLLDAFNHPISPPEDCEFPF